MPLDHARWAQPTLEDKVRFLGSAAAHPHCRGAVGAEETHMAWVFLAGDRVYKLKKPVVHSFLDFRSLAAREFVCREEVRLNRRLAPDIYLGVVALKMDAAGRLALGGRGSTVDWLVEMRRLPAARMLTEAIKRGTVTRQDLDAVADRLIDFYRTARPADVTPAAYIEHFAVEQAENRAVLLAPGSGLAAGAVAKLLQLVDRTLEDGTLLTGRVAAGRIVEGHGDLRPEHICLVHPPRIIDCLEFSLRFRQIDPLDELTFLYLECLRLGAGWAGKLILTHCTEALGDPPPKALLRFYWVYRACVRARLSLAHLRDPRPRTPEKWLPLARSYLSLAASPRLILGFPAAR